MFDKKYRPGIFAVVFKRVNGKIKYLVLRRVLHWEGWEFPKGGIEKENGGKAVRREVKEETGLKPKKIIKFNKKGKFRYDRELNERPGIIGQKWELFCVEVGKGKVSLNKNKDKEHDKYEWLDFEEAYEKLTWKNQKKCLKIVDNYLKKS